MIGIIVTGHGYFAKGITTSLELIIGEQDHYVAVNFPQGTSMQELDKELEAALDTLSDCEQIVICCDLFHGTPFNEAMMLALKHEHIKVLYGINVGMMIEMLMHRMQSMEFVELCETAIETGKTQIGMFRKEHLPQDEEDDDFN